MKRIDGGLRPEFRDRLQPAQWTSIETSTQPGVPDSEYCFANGQSGWVEFKFTTGWKIKFQPFQPSWIDRRARLGGRVWIAVRRRPSSKREAGRDELWLFPGSMALELDREGMKVVACPDIHLMGSEGPGSWNWRRVKFLLAPRD
jgi:hypothetical protein